MADKVQLTAEQMAEVYREATGRDVEVVDANDKFDIHEHLSLVDEARKPYIQKEIEPELTKLIEQNTVGKFTGLVRNVARKATGYEDKNEPWDVSLTKAFEKAKEGNSADVTALQQRLQELADEKEREKQEAIRTEQEKYNSLHSKITDRDAMTVLLSKVSAMKLRGDVVTHTEDLYNSLKRDYKIQLDDSGKEVQFFDKDNPALPAQFGKKAFNLDEYSSSFFEKRGVIEKDNRGKNPADTVQRNPIVPDRRTQDPRIDKNKSTLDSLLGQVPAQ